jgi:endonuclease-8
MPEGDTIFRAARALDRALSGRTITRFESVLPKLTRVDEDAPIDGRTVERVEARGKHLLMHLSGGLTLRTHMRMNGSWHIYRPGEAWRKARSHMRIAIETAEFVAVAFNVGEAEFLDARALMRHEELRQLGPDLLADAFDRDESLRRLRERNDGEIGAALIAQRVMAGAGNVFKSEILFVSRVNPFARVASLTDEDLGRIVDVARRLLQLNVAEGSSGRRTAGGLARGDRLWVYGRSGEPCRKCGTPIGFAKQGQDARVTYWCPSCQTLPA